MIEELMKKLNTKKDFCINIRNINKILSYCQTESNCDYCSRDSVYQCTVNKRYCWRHVTN
jgi:hypothetical protein